MSPPWPSPGDDGLRRKRTRSRSPERIRVRRRHHRDSSPDRERRRDRHDKRSASKDKTRGDSSHKAPESTPQVPVEDAEDMIAKRRERVRLWREEQAAKKAAELTNTPASASASTPSSLPNAASIPSSAPATGWSLDNDNEDETGDATAAPAAGGAEAMAGTSTTGGIKGSSDDEIDPLDAFMMENEKEVAKVMASTSGKGKGRAGTTAAGSTLGGAGGVGPGPAVPVDIEQEDVEEEEAPQDYLTMLEKHKARNKKDLKVVDHSKIDYLPFKKKFYIVPKEIEAMSEEEVHDLRMSMDNIKVRGKHIPRPIKSWAQAGLGVRVMNVIKKLGYEKPTPIQSQALPIVMSGRDCIGIAKTGSGKTCAFLLPLMRHILAQPPLRAGDGPIGLIMAPTRELAVQIFVEARKFAKPLNLLVTCAYGGAPISDQIAELKRGAHIVVCTPGRMIDLFCANQGRVTNTKRTTFVVLDEADRMFDMGFEPQIRKIIANVQSRRQTVLFSATFPKSIENLARTVLKKPVEIVVGGRSIVASDVTQVVEVRHNNTKFKRLLELLGEWINKGSCLIFVNKQSTCDNLFQNLIKAGYPALSLHGGMDQEDRHNTIQDFKAGVTNILIATSVAARGLDVKSLILVVNYACPNHHEDYVHRVGRTGRAGRKGWAYTFVTPDEDRYAPDLLKALEQSGTPVPEDLRKLVDGLADKKKSGQDVSHSSGFGGRGFKFDEKESQEKKAAQLAAKAAAGYVEEEVEDTSDLDATGEEGVGGTMPPTATAAADGVTLGAAAVPASSSTGASQTSDPTAALLNKPADQLTALEKAKLRAMELSGKLGVTPSLAAAGSGTAADGGESKGKSHFQAEVEINDYPQEVRWKITRKETLDDLVAFTDGRVAVTTRGSHYGPRDKIPEDDRKLFLLLEGDNEGMVNQAKMDVQAFLREQSLAALERQRYNIG